MNLEAINKCSSEAQRLLLSLCDGWVGGVACKVIFMSNPTTFDVDVVLRCVVVDLEF